MIKEYATQKDVIKVLNRALAKDPEAIDKLFKHREICNEELAEDEAIQVGTNDNKQYVIALLGIINGLFGIDETNGHGAICAVVDNKGIITKFDKAEDYV